jgi:hypothetical protein
LSSVLEQTSRELIKKCFRETMDLIAARNEMRKVRKGVTCCLPLEVQKELAPVRETENDGDVLTLQEDVPSSLDEVLE